MPGLGGLAVLRRLRHIRPQLHVILLSGHGSTADVEEGLRLGAFAYLQKPVDIDDFVELIHKAAREGGHEQDGG
jgi:DNA-binding NarL/FixJ family response regulator